jgi:hypothetical protein
MEELRLMETRDQINGLTTPVQQPAVNRSPSLRDNPSVDYVDLTTDTPPSEQYVDLTRPSAVSNNISSLLYLSCIIL